MGMYDKTLRELFQETNKSLENFYKEKKMPFIIDAKTDPLYNKGWNEAWTESWNKAQTERKIEDAIIMIKEFNLPIDTIAEKFEIDKNILIEKLKGNFENRN